jgi:hypothetical protein
MTTSAAVMIGFRARLAGKDGADILARYHCSAGSSRNTLRVPSSHCRVNASK